MKIRTLFLTTCLACLCVGCDDIVSTSPLVGDGQAIFDDRLLGTWVNPDGDKYTVERDQGDGYLNKDLSGDDDFSFKLTKIGSRHFLQMAEKDCTDHLFFKPGGGEQCYMFAEVEIEDNSFSFRLLDLERMVQDSLAKKLNLLHEVRREVFEDGSATTCIILTAPTEELRGFLEAYTADDSVFGMVAAELKRAE